MQVELDLRWAENQRDSQIQLKTESDAAIYVLDRRAIKGSEGRWLCELGRLIGRTQQGKPIITVFPEKELAGFGGKSTPVPVREAARAIAETWKAELKIAAS